MRIIYVEDNILLRTVVTEELRDLGYEVEEIDDCTSGLEAIRTSPPAFDALITDIETPGGLDGWQLGEMARLHAPGLPVIYATGSSLDKARPVPDGMIVRKPFTTASIAQCLGHIPERAIQTYQGCEWASRAGQASAMEAFRYGWA